MRAEMIFLLAAVPASAQIAVVSTEPFSVGRAALSHAEIDDLLTAPNGPYVIVADRLVRVPSAIGSAEADVPIPLDEGTALMRARVTRRLDALRAAAKEGRLTPADKAEARALAAARSALMGLEDRWFLRSLSPELSDEDFLKIPEPVAVPAPGPTGPADALTARLRARLVLEDRGDPRAREALDMAVRLLLESPTARELAAEFVERGSSVVISFELLENSVLINRGGRKYVSGYGGVASQGSDGLRIKLNRDYLSTDASTQLQDLPATLAHELLGHALGAVRAQAAGVEPAWNRWRGDETTAGVAGWLVSAELGHAPNDMHMWRYLEDPERYYLAMHLAGSYYAGTFSAAAAADPRHAYEQRLARVDTALELLETRAADKTDWDKVIDHFEQAHALPGRRLALLRVELKPASREELAAERELLLAVRRSLFAAAAELSAPAAREAAAALAKDMERPFFSAADERLARLTERLRAAVSRAGVKAPKRDPEDIDAAELAALYQKDLVENPSHWPAPAN